MEKMNKTKMILDGGTLNERLAEMKEFFGLRPDQSFQDLDVEPLEDDEDEDCDG